MPKKKEDSPEKVEKTQADGLGQWEEKDLLHTLIENIPLNVYFKDKDSKFVKVNTSTAKRLGVGSPQGLLGKSDQDFFDEEHATCAFQNEKKIMQTGKPQVDLLEHETRKGRSDTWVITTKMPWRDSKGNMLGTFGVSSDVTELILTQKHLAHLADELNHRNAMVEEELALAREIQQSFLPKQSLDFPSDNKPLFQVENRYFPSSTLAGDFFDVLPIDENHLGVFICDVMGHGVRSSLVACMLRGLMEQEQEICTQPDAFLSHLNDGLADLLLSRGTMIFASAFYGVFDLKKDLFRYCNAGHPSPLFIAEKKAEFLPPISSPALGLTPKVQYEEKSISLEGFQRLLLFTDGLIECGEFAEAENVHKKMVDLLSKNASLATCLDSLMGYAKEMAGKDGLKDDLCVVAVEKYSK